MSSTGQDPRTGVLWDSPVTTIGTQIDQVNLALIGMSLLFIFLIGGLALGFGVKYRASTTPLRGKPIARTTVVELVWVTSAFLLAISIFVWGAAVFINVADPPPGAQTIYVVGKQWMWKLRHPNGRREMDELHVPTGTPIRLVMASEDVIHSFYIPAFRLKYDVLPNTYTTMWFEVREPGEFHLFCAEYCGSLHSQMRGRVVAMDPQDFQRWLSIEETDYSPPPTAGEVAEQPKNIRDPLLNFACTDCHSRADTGPSLAGIYGRYSLLENGKPVLVDEQFLRRALFNPNVEISRGYTSPSTMPSYRGQLNEDQLIEIIEAIKDLPDSTEAAR